MTARLGVCSRPSEARLGGVGLPDGMHAGWHARPCIRNTGAWVETWPACCTQMASMRGRNMYRASRGQEKHQDMQCTSANTLVSIGFESRNRATPCDPARDLGLIPALEATKPEATKVLWVTTGCPGTAQYVHYQRTTGLEVLKSKQSKACKRYMQRQALNARAGLPGSAAGRSGVRSREEYLRTNVRAEYTSAGGKCRTVGRRQVMSTTRTC